MDRREQGILSTSPYSTNPLVSFLTTVLVPFNHFNGLGGLCLPLRALRRVRIFRRKCRLWVLFGLDHITSGGVGCWSYRSEILLQMSPQFTVHRRISVIGTATHLDPEYL